MNRGAGIRYGLSFHVLALPFRQNAESHDVALSQVQVDPRLHAIIAERYCEYANNLLVSDCVSTLTIRTHVVMRSARS
jgi:hypothetical protein